MNLIGLNSGDSNKHDIHIHGHHKALFAQRSLTIPLIHQSRRPFRNAMSGVPQEENPYLHPEPYGYLFHDDVRIFHLQKIILNILFYLSLIFF